MMKPRPTTCACCDSEPENYELIDNTCLECQATHLLDLVLSKYAERKNRDILIDRDLLEATRDMLDSFTQDKH